MIGRKQQPGAFQREGGMVGGMAGRQDRPKRPAVACDHIAVRQGNVRRESQYPRRCRAAMPAGEGLRRRGAGPRHSTGAPVCLLSRAASGE